MFLNWQDASHRRLHVAGVERDVENLRSGAGAEMSADDLEMVARDVEDLIRSSPISHIRLLFVSVLCAFSP